MTTVDTLRNNIVEKLLAISNKDYLLALNKLVEKKTSGKKTIKLSKAQIALLKLSDDDIKKGKFISQETVDYNDLKWLKSL